MVGSNVLASLHAASLLHLLLLAIGYGAIGFLELRRRHVAVCPKNGHMDIFALDAVFVWMWT